MVNMTPAVPSLSAEPPINGNGTNGHSVSGNMVIIIIMIVISVIITITTCVTVVLRE